MENFELEVKSVWSFEDRGNWGVHKGDYPGNWSPFIPKNIILRYSNYGDIVLDQFLGSGTTIMEAKNLGRNYYGCDINENALKIAHSRIEKTIGRGTGRILNADARKLNFLNDKSIDLICTHPPYLNIIQYSKNDKRDLSLVEDEKYYESIERVAEEAFRVLKNGKYCVVMMGDIRRRGFIIPLGFRVMNIFIEVGFRIKEIIIKEQHNCSSTSYWKEISKKRNFYLLAHEYIYVFYK